MLLKKLLKEEAQKKKSATTAKGATQGKSQQTVGFNFFTEEAPGLKVSPKSVLITSLVYIGVVVLLHIWAKIRSDTPASATPDL